MKKRVLTEDIIQELKRTIDKPLFKKDVAGQEYIFTFMTREEHKGIQRWIEENGDNVQPTDVDEKIVGVGLLWPKMEVYEWNGTPAGTVFTLSRLIQEKSGFDPDGMGSIPGMVTTTLVEYAKEDKPTEAVVDELKKQCPHPLKLVSMCGKHFIIRPMLRSEHTALQKMSANVDDFDSEAAKRCVIYPKPLDFSTLPAGIPGALLGQVMLMSGFNESGDVEEL